MLCTLYRALALVVATMSLLLTGCSTPSRDASHAPMRRLLASVNPALALNGDEASGPAWEIARRDANLGSPGSPNSDGYGIAEIRQYDFLRTTNGRPQNDSWTSSRSIQRRSGP